MGRNKKHSDKQIAKLSLATALIALATQIINLLTKIIEWLSKQEWGASPFPLKSYQIFPFAAMSILNIISIVLSVVGIVVSCYTIHLCLRVLKKDDRQEVPHERN